MIVILLLVAAYLLGSTPTSYLIARVGAGIDLRQQGSGNLGATNLYRVLGWRFAVPAGIADILKGAVPVLAVPHLTSVGETWLPWLVGVAAVLGHVFPVFLRFKGGKGVATAAGVILALAPKATALSAVVWVAAVGATGYVSLASMLGAVTFPIASRILTPEREVTFGVGLAMAAFIIFTHRSNIRRLFAGTENRFGHRRNEA